MEYVLPVAAFGFFLGLLAFQARRNGNPSYDPPAPTADQRRVARVFQVVLVVAWALTLVGADALLPLLAPAGALILATGIAFQADYKGLREAFERIHAGSFAARRLGARSVPPLWGVLAIVIGAGFLAGGVAAAIAT